MTRRDRWLPELECGALEGDTPASTYGRGVGAQLAKLREQRDEARAEVARLRRRVVELEDAAQVDEARRREARRELKAVLEPHRETLEGLADDGEPSPERLYAMHRHGPKRGGRG